MVGCIDYSELKWLVVTGLGGLLALLELSSKCFYSSLPSLTGNGLQEIVKIFLNYYLQHLQSSLHQKCHFYFLHMDISYDITIRKKPYSIFFPVAYRR